MLGMAGCAPLPNEVKQLRTHGAGAETIIHKARSSLESAQVFASTAVGYAGSRPEACWALSVIVKYDAQVADELDAEAGEFNVFLFCFAVAGLVALCLLIIIGIVLGLLAFAAATGIGVAGIAANAILAGLLSKSPRVGLTALVLQFGAGIGLAFGVAASSGVRWLLGDPPFDTFSLVAGGVSGAVLGALLTGVSFSLLRACFRQLKDRSDGSHR